MWTWNRLQLLWIIHFVISKHASYNLPSLSRSPQLWRPLELYRQIQNLSVTTNLTCALAASVNRLIRVSACDTACLCAFHEQGSQNSAQPPRTSSVLHSFQFLFLNPCYCLCSLQQKRCMHQPEDWCTIFPSYESVSVSYTQVSLNANGVTYWSPRIFISDCRKSFSFNWGKYSSGADATRCSWSKKS